MADDAYIWLEEVRGQAAMSWVDGQSRRTLDAFRKAAQFEVDRQALLAVSAGGDRLPVGTPSQRHVYNFTRDAQNPRGIWRRSPVAAYEAGKPVWRTLLDLAALAEEEGETWIFRGAAVAPGERSALVRLSTTAGDASAVREFDLVAGAFDPRGFRLAEARSEIAYMDPSTVLVATDFGEGSLTRSGRPRCVRLWRRGEPLGAAQAVLEGDPDDLRVAPTGHDDPTTARSLIVRKVTMFENAYFLVDGQGRLEPVPLPPSAEVRGVCAGWLIFTLRQRWDRGDVALPEGSLNALQLARSDDGDSPPALQTLYRPTPLTTVTDVAVTDQAVYAAVYENVTGRIEVFRRREPDWVQEVLDLPGGGSTGIVAVDPRNDAVHLTFQGFLTPPTLYQVRGSLPPRRIQSTRPAFEGAALVEEQHFATSADGRRIPYFLIRRRGEDGPVPTILHGYGGFQVATTPWYWPAAGKVWLEAGGALAVANVRGGGEFGPAWHRAASKARRQRAFDDFASVGFDLVARGVTTHRQLGLLGHSNGALMAAVVMTQHPGLAGAVVCRAPLTDMLRFTELGAGRSWVSEYGDPRRPSERIALEHYSPFHAVRPDVAYPPVLFMAGTHDDRATPGHARKMAAKMIDQGHPAWFYENKDGGHVSEGGAEQSAQVFALAFAFFKRHLGLQV